MHDARNFWSVRKNRIRDSEGEKSDQNPGEINSIRMGNTKVC